MSASFDKDTIISINEKSTLFQALVSEIAKNVVGQHEAITFIQLALLCNGHILLEGVPGIAKTTMIKAIGYGLGLHCARIQFTPDLLPSDLIGTLIYNPKTHEFETKKGPIFAHLVLADEINRAPAKVQAALLESMQERQVTIGSHTFPLEEPFLVFATQNPIEQEGTYRLPEAQVDRFMFKLIINYPTKKEELDILKLSYNHVAMRQIITHNDIIQSQKLVTQIYVDEKINDYIINIVFATRNPRDYGLSDLSELIEYGVSPRATLALHSAARAYAFLKHRHFVIPDDVKYVAYSVLRHRLILTYQAEADNITADNVIQKILSVIPTP